MHEECPLALLRKDEGEALLQMSHTVPVAEAGQRLTVLGGGAFSETQHECIVVSGYGFYFLFLLIREKSHAAHAGPELI